MSRYEFSFETTPELGPLALKCLLWKRGKVFGPIALVLFPLLLLSRMELHRAANACGTRRCARVCGTLRA